MLLRCCQYLGSVCDAARQSATTCSFVTDGDGASAVKHITSSNQVDGVVLRNVTHA